MKSTKHSVQRLGNHTIHSVLDGIVTISQIDPTWVQPDHHFQNDLALNADQILKIGQFASQNLGLNLSPEDEARFQGAKTPRELVSQIESFLERHNVSKAG